MYLYQNSRYFDSWVCGKRIWLFKICHFSTIRTCWGCWGVTSRDSLPRKRVRFAGSPHIHSLSELKDRNLRKKKYRDKFTDFGGAKYKALLILRSQMIRRFRTLCSLQWCTTCHPWPHPVGRFWPRTKRNMGCPPGSTLTYHVLKRWFRMHKMPILAVHASAWTRLSR